MLKMGGTLIINEQHPVTNMLSLPCDENYQSEVPTNIINSYFDKEWIETQGMQYITKKAYKSKSFINYTQSFTDIIGSICKSGLYILGLHEFDYDISNMFTNLNHKGIPLSYIIKAKKEIMV